MMRPKRTCTAADTASAAPAKRVRRGAADGAASTGKAATGVEQHGAGPTVPCVQVTTSRHVKGAAAENRSHTFITAETAVVASPCSVQAGPAAPTSEQATEPGTRGHTEAHSAARSVPSLPAAEPVYEPEEAVAAAAAASMVAADVPLSSDHTAAGADKAGDTELGAYGDVDLTERLRSAARCFEERHAGYLRLYECASLPAAFPALAPCLEGRGRTGRHPVQRPAGHVLAACPCCWSFFNYALLPAACECQSLICCGSILLQATTIYIA